jgi:PIN domain nuclease of toxin-antitoxin system
VSGLLLDTCAAIWLATGAPMATAARKAIVAAALDAGVLVSSATAWEIGLLSRRGLQFLPDPKSWFRTLLGMNGVRLAPLTPDIAIDSSLLPGEVHGDPADRMLIATARSLGVPIVTRDRLILAYAKAGQVKALAC